MIKQNVLNFWFEWFRLDSEHRHVRHVRTYLARLTAWVATTTTWWPVRPDTPASGRRSRQPTENKTGISVTLKRPHLMATLLGGHCIKRSLYWMVTFCFILRSEHLVSCPIGAYVFITLLEGPLPFAVKKSCTLDRRETEFLLYLLLVFCHSCFLRLKMYMVKVYFWAQSAEVWSRSHVLNFSLTALRTEQGT